AASLPPAPLRPSDGPRRRSRAVGGLRRSGRGRWSACGERIGSGGRRVEPHLGHRPRRLLRRRARAHARPPPSRPGSGRGVAAEHRGRTAHPRRIRCRRARAPRCPRPRHRAASRRRPAGAAPAPPAGRAERPGERRAGRRQEDRRHPLQLQRRPLAALQSRAGALGAVHRADVGVLLLRRRVARPPHAHGPRPRRRGRLRLVRDRLVGLAVLRRAELGLVRQGRRRRARRRRRPRRLRPPRLRAPEGRLLPVRGHRDARRKLEQPQRDARTVGGGARDRPQLRVRARRARLLQGRRRPARRGLAQLRRRRVRRPLRHHGQPLPAPLQR
ncbi:MAG: hypothetical protein AVDCRST_MAG69-84, partial [uncultured Solirubrobacteraceae bacterium]